MNRCIVTLSDEELRKEFIRVSDWWLCVRSVGEMTAADAAYSKLVTEFERRGLETPTR